MSLLLLFAGDAIDTGYSSPISVPPWGINIRIGAEEPLGMPPPGLRTLGPLGLQPLRNEFVRAIEDFSITYNLLNRAVMSCRTVDPRVDLENAYRPVTNQRVIVTTEDGTATIFSGRIISVRETSIEREARTGTTLAVDIVDDAEIFEYTYITRSFGVAAVQIASVEAGNPAVIHTKVPHTLITGITVDIAGVTGGPVVINGERVVTVVDADTFTIPLNLATGGTDPGGTVRARVYLRDAVDAVFAEAHLADYGIVRDPAMELGPLLEFYNFDTTVKEVFTTMFGAAKWVWRLLPTKVLQGFFPGDKVADFTFNELTCLGSPDIEKTRAGFANTVRVTFGSNALVDKFDDIYGDGVKTRWPLTYQLKLTPEGQVPGNFEAGGVSGVPAPWNPADTTSEWMFDQTTNELVHNASFGVWPAGMIGHFSYKSQFPQVLYVKDDALIAEQGGKWIKRLDLPDVYEIGAALEQGETELENIKVQPRKVGFSTRQSLVLPGTTIPVNFPARLMSSSTPWMVTSVTITEDEDGMFRYRYEIQEDNKYHPGWIEFFQEMANGGSTATTPTSSTIPAPPATGAGIGTPGKFAKWATTTTLTDAANLDEITGGVRLNGFLRGHQGGTYDFTLQNTGGGTVFRVPTTTQLAEFSGAVRTTTIDSPSLTDLAITPAGSLIVDPASKLLIPNLSYDINIGTLQKKFLTLYAAELWVETLVAQNTIATIGGRILVGPTTPLTLDVSTMHTSITVKYNNLLVSDIIYFEADGKVEFMQITAGPTTVAEGYRYSVIRNLDGTGANQWFAGDAAFNTGQTGNGFIDLYSVRGIRASSETGPTIVGNVRNSATYNDWSPRWAIGNLRGLHGIGVNTFGAAFGKPGNPIVMVDDTNGIRIFRGATTFMQLGLAGDATFTGVVTITGGNGALADMSNVTTIDGGKITTNSITASKISVTSLSAITANVGILTINTGGYLASAGMGWTTGGPGVFLGWTGAAYGFAVGNWLGQRLVWDGGNLGVIAGNITIDITGITIGTGTSTSGSRIWIGGAILHATNSGRLDLTGNFATEGSGFIQCGGDFACFGNAAVTGSLTVTGMVSPTNGMDINGNIHWTNPATTDADDYPLVRSEGNGNVYKKTDGFNGTLNLTGGGTLVVERGLVISGG